MPRKPTGYDHVYQLKITLYGSKPPIWRRIQVRSHITLATLSDIIQATMAWEGYHLHAFMIHDVEYGVPDPDGMDLREVRREDRVVLHKLAPAEGERWDYVYDFGDSWVHTLLFEKQLPAEEGAQYPRCLTGRRASPPEDCGGIWGYAAMLEALQDPDHPEYAMWDEWIGADFDPAAFDCATVNQALEPFR